MAISPVRLNHAVLGRPAAGGAGSRPCPQLANATVAQPLTANPTRCAAPSTAPARS